MSKPIFCEKKKTASFLSSAEFDHRVVKVKELFLKVWSPWILLRGMKKNPFMPFSNRGSPNQTASA